MSKIFFIKQGDSIAPTSPESVRNWTKIGQNVEYCMEVKKPRNPRFHKLVFAVLKATLANMPEGSSWSELYKINPQKAPYLFLKAIQLDTGLTEPFMRLDGTIEQRPMSISFANMDDDEFQEVTDPIFSVCANFLNVTVEELKANYSEYL